VGPAKSKKYEKILEEDEGEGESEKKPVHANTKMKLPRATDLLTDDDVLALREAEDAEEMELGEEEGESSTLPNPVEDILRKLEKTGVNVAVRFLTLSVVFHS